MSDRVPFTILTGFLGAGKTTALNRLLGARVPRRVAVLVNDLGLVNVDRALITARHGDVLELSGGCVCCAVNVQRDLWAGILDLLERAAPEHLVLETTGIAEPHLILDRLGDAGGPGLAVLPAGVVCVVDGEAGERALRERSEAIAQVEHAERILLSKLDRASARDAEAVRVAIRALNPDAELASFPPGDDAATRALANWLLEIRPLNAAALRFVEREEDSSVDALPAKRPHAHATSRHGQLCVVTFTDDAPLLAGALLEVVSGLGAKLLRCKGFVNVAGDERRGFLEKAGAAPPALTPGSPWPEGARRRTELVFIGDGLDDHAILRRLWAARTAV